MKSHFIVTQMWLIGAVIAPTIPKQLICLGTGVLFLLIGAGAVLARMEEA